MTAPPLGEHVGAIVVAAGRGERLGEDRPKALVEVAGRALVSWAVDGVRAAGVRHLVVVFTPDREADFVAALGGRLEPGTTLTPGGADRSASVRAGIEALPPQVTLVAVHDAARAFTPPEVITATVAAVTGDVIAAAPALPVADTIKRVDGAQVTGTVDRRDLVAVQTPQVMTSEVLRHVARARGSATDDLALVEQHLASGELEGRIVWVPGSVRGRKVTSPEDLVLAAAVATTVP